MTEYAIALAALLTNDYPADRSLAALSENPGAPRLHLVNELLVRGNLPAATREVVGAIGL